jgi:hypothetical protein
MTMSTPKRTSLSLTFAIAAAWPMLGAAQPAADSAYRTDAQSTHVEDATSRGIQQVNMITCFLSSRTNATPARAPAARPRRAPAATRRRTCRPWST